MVLNPIYPYQKYQAYLHLHRSLIKMTNLFLHSNFAGKAFSVLAVADNAAPIISGVIYNQVYKATMHVYPNVFFFVTILTQLLVIVIVVYVLDDLSSFVLLH